MNEVYFVVVVRNAEPLDVEMPDGTPCIYAAGASEDYEEAETFQKMLLSTLYHGDKVIVVGANFDKGEGITDVKAVLQNEVN